MLRRFRCVIVQFFLRTVVESNDEITQLLILILILAIHGKEGRKERSEVIYIYMRHFNLPAVTNKEGSNHSRYDSFFGLLAINNNNTLNERKQ